MTRAVGRALRWGAWPFWLAALWSAAVVSRVPVGSGLRRLAGDMLDTELALAIQLHWPNLLAGAALGWNRTFYFYPASDTLGYNDAFLAHGLLLAVPRALGADIFLAGQIAEWLLRAAGFAGFYLLARRMAAGPPAAALGAALFATASAMYVHGALHGQLLAVDLLPALALAEIAAWRRAVAQRRVAFAGYTVLAGLLLGTLFLTCYYVAFFAALLAAFTLAALAPVLLASHAETLRARVPMALYGAAQLQVFVLCLVPFLATYLPKARETGMHPIRDALPFAPRLVDVFNVGPFNLLWSHVFARFAGMFEAAPFGGGEMQTAATPLVFALFLFAPVLLAPRLSRLAGARPLATAIWAGTLATLAIAIAWPDGSWGWRAIYRFVPGAAGLRVVARVQLVLLLPMTLLASLGVQQIARRAGAAGGLLLGALLLLEQLNTAPVFNLPRARERDWLARVDRPPASCRFFAAANARPGPDVQTLYRHNIDAMLVAEVARLPTVNGYSTFQPTGWALAHPEAPDYAARLTGWREARGLGPGCTLDFRAEVWRTP